MTMLFPRTTRCAHVADVPFAGLFGIGRCNMLVFGTAAHYNAHVDAPMERAVLEPADVRAQLDAIEAARGGDVVCDPLPVVSEPVAEPDAGSGVFPAPLVQALDTPSSVSDTADRPSIRPVMAAVLAFVEIGWLAAAVLRSAHEHRETPSLQAQ